MWLQIKDKRIKLINHSKNLKVYTSRVDGILVSSGKYIIFPFYLINQMITLKK